MKTDPRSKNTWFRHGSMTDYFSDYKKALSQAVESVSSVEMEKAHKTMVDVAGRGGTFYVAGNGGSAAVADHLCCDWTKGTFGENLLPLKAISMGGNVPLMTAIANDFGFEDIFSQHLKMMANPNDALFVISSSGNSPNIVKALEMAQQLELPTIALTGFSGGKANQLAQVKLHVDFANYAIVEDAHQAIMQALAQFFFVAQESKK